MLDPLHQCWWTRTRWTSLRLRSQSLVSAGATLRGFLLGATEPGLVWFSSMSWADYDLDDDAQFDPYTEWQFRADRHVENMMMLGVRPPLSADLNLLSRPIDGPVSHFLAGMREVREFELTHAVAGRLELDEPEYARVDQLVRTVDDVACAIYSHDECFTTIYPSQEDIVHRAVAQVLEVQAWYLGRDYDWRDVVPELVTLLHTNEEVDMRAHPEHGVYPASITLRLKPAQKPPIAQRVRRAVGRISGYRYSIQFQGDRAILVAP